MKISHVLGLCSLLVWGCTENKSYYILQPDASSTVPADMSAAPACIATQRECVDATSFHVCHADGQWGTDIPCGQGFTCDQGDCQVDINGVACNPGDGLCLQGMALTCKTGGSGYDVKSCPADTECGGPGLCVGACGPVGSTQCLQDPTQIATCDGNTLTISACPPPGADGRKLLCVSKSDGTAACAPSDCDPTVDCDVCGNPTNATVSVSGATSTCTATDSGYHWISTVCSAPDTCQGSDPRLCAALGIGASCGSDCKPGTVRCADAPLNGLQTCGADGKFGPVMACADAAGEKCITRNGAAVCADPVCQLLLADGACVSAGGASELRACDATGHLAADAKACATGSCVFVGNTRPNGLSPGRCSAVCSTGQQRCLNSNNVQDCVNGLWSAATTPCQTDGGAGAVSCLEIPPTLPEQVTTATCGVDDCTPGDTRCVNGGGAADAAVDLPFVETCLPTHKWGASAQCTVGFCRDGQGCMVECVPAQTVCVGDPSLDPIPLAFGTDHQGVCTDDGHLPAPLPAGLCPNGTSCRTDQTGQSLGCVVCVGKLNENGLADTRCANAAGTTAAVAPFDPADPLRAAVQVCKPDSTGWQAPVQCGQPDWSCADPDLPTFPITGSELPADCVQN